MEPFNKKINGIDFQFHGFLERDEEVCVVRADDQQFKMTVHSDGYWHILQQVPKWVKEMEQSLGKAIDEAYG